jgi:hypothetical protein
MVAAYVPTPDPITALQTQIATLQAQIAQLTQK